MTVGGGGGGVTEMAAAATQLRRRRGVRRSNQWRRGIVEEFWQFLGRGDANDTFNSSIITG